MLSSTRSIKPFGLNLNVMQNSELKGDSLASNNQLLLSAPPSPFLLAATNETEWNEPDEQEIEKASLYTERIITIEENNRVPELFRADHPGIMYYQERNGIITTLIHNPNNPSELLSEHEKQAILEFLFAQYLNPKVGITGSYYDPVTAMRYNLRSEPYSFFSQGDIHAIVGTEDGQILGYLGVKGSLPSGLTLASPEINTISHVLKVFKNEDGTSAYCEIPEFATLDASRIREMRKFVVRQELLTSGLNARGALVSTELILSLIDIADQFKSSVDIIIGDTDPSVTGKNLQAFNIPVQFVEGRTANPANLSKPYDMLWSTRYQGRDVKPFVVRVKDINGLAHQVSDQITLLLNENPRQAFMALIHNLNRVRNDSQLVIEA